MVENASPAAAPAPRKSLINNPVPVGVGGFALTTFTLGLYTSGVLDQNGIWLVVALAAFYGGLTQFVAGFFALARGDLFPAAFMTSYGAFWLSYDAVLLWVVPKAGAAANQAVFIFLIMWTVITLIFTLAAFGTNWMVVITFIVFDIAIILEDIGVGGSINIVSQIGGYFEMLLAALAWYIVMAEIVNETLGRTIFPLFPIKR